MHNAEGGTVTITAITYSYLNGQRVAQQRDSVFSGIHSDHLSSATRITDAAGLEIRRLAYTSFGEEAENTGKGDDPKYTYTGKEHDATGLYYYGARYYDPALSRFPSTSLRTGITADTVYDVGPQGLNRYSYALNNPIIYRDPTGHFALEPDDDNNPGAYESITGSQAQFADGTATVHDGGYGGFNQTLDEYEQDVLPPLEKGDKGDVAKSEIEDKKTTPPPEYTEAL